jgi:hypothetical protein
VTNLIEQYQSFSQDGLELVINIATGGAFASQRATARMLEVDEATIRRNITSAQIAVKSAEISTATGFKTAALISAQDIFKLAVKYNPELAIKMGTAGATVYLYGLSGYSVKPIEKSALEQPNLPNDEVGWIEYALAEKKKSIALAAQIEADSEPTALGKSIQITSEHIRIGEFAKQIGMGQNKYFRELRDCGIIMIDSRLPYQKYMKYFKITQTQQNGKWYQVAVINAKGQAYLAKRHTQWLERQSALELIELELPAIV